MDAEDYLPLTCPCPSIGSGCLREGKTEKEQMLDWYRSSCKHRTNINSEAWCKCMVPECNDTGGSIISRRFDCGKHTHEEQYLGVNEMSLVHASAVMLASRNNYSDKAWIKRLAKAFLREIDKLPES